MPKMKTMGRNILIFLNKCKKIFFCSARHNVARQQLATAAAPKAKKKWTDMFRAEALLELSEFSFFSPQRASEDIGRTCTQQRSSSGDPLVYTLSQKF